MKLRIAIGAALSAALFISCVQAGESLQSGPQVGKNIPGPFDVQNVTGPWAGSKLCLV